MVQRETVDFDRFGKTIRERIEVNLEKKCREIGETSSGSFPVDLLRVSNDDWREIAGQAEFNFHELEFSKIPRYQFKAGSGE